MLKKLGVVLGVVLALILVVPAFLPSKARVVRAVDVNAPTSKVFTVISDFNQFAKWNPWAEMEPSAKIEVSGQGIGSTYSWQGEKTGSGMMTMTEMTTDSNVKVKMNFKEPWESEAMSEWSLISTSNNTSKIVWEFDQDLPYLQRFFGLSMDKMLGPSFEKGLSNLKKTVE